MKLLLTGSTNEVKNPNFPIRVFQSLALAGVDLEDVSCIHRLSRAGFELATIKVVNMWCEEMGSRIAIRNHDPFQRGDEGGKNIRKVMHGKVIQPDMFDLAVLFTDNYIDEHLENVIYWLDKRSIPYVLAEVGVQSNEKVRVSGTWFSNQEERDGESGDSE